MGQMIYTLSVNEINNYCTSSYTIKNKETVSVDLTNHFIFDSVVLSREEIGENAFIYQVLKLISNGNKEVFGKIRKDEETLLEHLFIMSFKSINNSEKESGLGKYILDNGIEVRFSEDKYFHFVPMDKSGSMAKENKIIFIHDALRDDLFERLMLGIPAYDAKPEKHMMPDIQTNASKLYAYRGLYMTNAVRIKAIVSGKNNEENNKHSGLLLNSDTVLVMDDESGVDVTWAERKYAFLSKPSNCITAESSGTKNEEGKLEWNLNTKKDVVIPLKPFDGEGLICPEYARLINKQLKIPCEGEQLGATSFQIRMPFCKGMLHCLSWKDLIKEQIKDNNLDINYEDLYIKDIYGRWRKLEDIRIILTTTMFKCNKWWGKHCSHLNITDEMEHYFSQMQTYDHSLYISSTNALYPNMGKTITTYQFLNPMKLTEDDLKTILEEHKIIIEEIKSNPLKALTDVDISEEKGTDEKNGEKETQEEKEKRDTRTMLLKALQTNEYIIKDPYIRSKLGDYQASMIRDIYHGRLSVAGQLKLLSGDLLVLIAVIVDRCKIGNRTDGVTKEENIIKLTTSIFEKRLFEKEFYLPQAKIISPSQDEYVILRNPHLSRYEESIVQKIKGKRLEYYKKHFNHLNGIVMVSCQSIVPQAIGGADFDGDIVRVFSNQHIVDAVKKGIILDQNDPETQNGSSDRIPFVCIPDPASVQQQLEIRTQEPIKMKIDPDTILRTFSNQVGHISNMAIRFGEIEYGHAGNKLANGNQIFRVKDKAVGPETVDYDESLCAEGCILTGLELDANKNGFRPSLDGYEIAGKVLDEYKKSSKISKKDYLYYLNKLDQYNFQKIEFYKDKNQGDSFSLKGINGKRRLLIPKETTGNLLESLPWECLNIYDTVRPQKDNGRWFTVELDLYRKAQESCIFWFESINPVFDPDTKKQVENIITAYNKINKEAGKRYRSLQAFKNARYFGRIRIILTMQYGDMKLLLDKDRTVEMVMLDAYHAINNYLELDADNTRKAFLEKIINTWMYMPMNDRIDLLKKITDDKQIIQLLSNFNNRGYYLLYYIAKHIYLSQKEQDDMNEAVIESIVDSLSYNMDDDEMAEQDNIESDMDYEDKYRKVFHKAFLKKDDQYRWKKELIKECREDIKKLFGQNTYLDYQDNWKIPDTEDDKKTDAALACLYSMRQDAVHKVDSGGWFFWKVFSWEEIERNLLKKREDHNNVE